jgi:hypothetical protein
VSKWWPEQGDTFRFETTQDLHVTDDRNFYKVEKWTKDGANVDRLLYAGNSLEEARMLFARAIQHRPRIRLTIRQGTRVLEQCENRLRRRDTTPLTSKSCGNIAAAF